jgi:amidase
VVANLGQAGIPFGMSFVGKPWSEEKLIGLAYAFEQKTQTGKTIKPVIVPTTELKVRGAAKYNDDL